MAGGVPLRGERVERDPLARVMPLPSGMAEIVAGQESWLVPLHLRRRREVTGITVPMVLDGSMTAEWFLAYTQQVFAPTLRPGGVVILDNLPARKGTTVQRRWRQQAPRCSSSRPSPLDFNSIENAFAELKTRSRQAVARTVDQLRRVIGQVPGCLHQPSAPVPSLPPA